MFIEGSPLAVMNPCSASGSFGASRIHRYIGIAPLSDAGGGRVTCDLHVGEVCTSGSI